MNITLTHEEAQQVLGALENFCEYGAILKPLEVRDLLRAKLSEPEPEPVAFVVYDSESNDIVWTEAGKKLKQNTRLYTYPPQRKWVGLTDDEHMKLAEEWGCLSADWVLYAAAVERKLKDKNNGL